LAEALKGNSILKVLDIGGNNISPEGIKVLLVCIYLRVCILLLMCSWQRH